MRKVVHTSRISIVREKGPTRKATIEGFSEPIYYGVHGGIKQFYRVEPEKEHAATLDHIVAATAAWMMGTLATLLAGKKIRTPEDSFRAEVEGDIEDVSGILKITQIRVTYHLKVSNEKVDEAREAFSSYLAACPAAQSVIGCIAIQDHLEIEEMTWVLRDSCGTLSEPSKTWGGDLPICSFCKKIRNHDKIWESLENYISEHSEAQFSHTVCEECAREHYGQFADRGNREPLDAL